MSRISQLESQIEQVKREQATCQHVWGKPFSNPEKKKEEFCDGSIASTQGIHLNYRRSFRDVEVPRWTRVCTKCELEQHSYEQQNVAVPEMQPKF